MNVRIRIRFPNIRNIEENIHGCESFDHQYWEINKDGVNNFVLNSESFYHLFIASEDLQDKWIHGSFHGNKSFVFTKWHDLDQIGNNHERRFDDSHEKVIRGYLDETGKVENQNEFDLLINCFTLEVDWLAEVILDVGYIEHCWKHDYVLHQKQGENQEEEVSIAVGCFTNMDLWDPSIVNSIHYKAIENDDLVKMFALHDWVNDMGETRFLRLGIEDSSVLFLSGLGH